MPWDACSVEAADGRSPSGRSTGTRLARDRLPAPSQPTGTGTLGANDLLLGEQASIETGRHAGGPWRPVAPRANGAYPDARMPPAPDGGACAAPPAPPAPSLAAAGTLSLTRARTQGRNCESAQTNRAAASSVRIASQRGCARRERRTARPPGARIASGRRRGLRRRRPPCAARGSPPAGPPLIASEATQLSPPRSRRAPSLTGCA